MSRIGNYKVDFSELIRKTEELKLNETAIREGKMKYVPKFIQYLEKLFK